MTKVYIVIEDTDETSIVIGVTPDESVAERVVDAIDAESDDDESGAFYTEAELVDSVDEMLAARDRVWQAYLADAELGASQGEE